ncbi:hypothetical protein CRUP_019958, partial [Coryphaenoides rupestris]
MSGAAEGPPAGAPEGPPAGDLFFSDTFRVTLKTTIATNDFAVGLNCTVSQLKGCVAERLGTSAEQLVLIHSGHILSGSDLLSQHKGEDGMVSLYMFISPQLSSTSVQAVVTDNSTFHDNLTPSPTSPLCLVEELGSWGPSFSDPGFFRPLQSQMERQLLSDPEMVSRLLGTPLVRGALSASNPQLTRQLLRSNPLTLRLLQTNPEMADMLDDPDVIAEVGGLLQMIELAHNPDTVQEVMRNQNCGLTGTDRERAPGGSLQKTKINSQGRQLGPRRAK